MIDKAIVYCKQITSIYGNIKSLKVAVYETNEDFKEIISDYKVKWAKVIDMETGKVFKSYFKEKE